MLFRHSGRLSGVAVTLFAAPAAAVDTIGSGDWLRPAALWLIALVGAAVAHWALRRVGRRLPRRLARRSGQPLTAGMPLPWEGSIHLVVLIAQLSTWLLAAVFATNQLATFQQARDMFTHVVVMSLTSAMFVINGKGYSALSLLELPLVLMAVWIGISGLTRVLKAHVLSATRMERGLQEAVALLTRYTLIFLAGVVVLQLWGIDASSLAFVASVLGVGIGFGLQHIANNFVSGLVVSLERPIQPGDFVKVGEWTGTVERVGPRNTEIRTNDNVSILVPNSRFLETEVVNWTHGDPVCRLHIPVAVAYRSELRRVRAALLDAARNHRDVLTDPRPQVELRGFGESALNFELEVWTRDPRNQSRLISELNYRIAASLSRHQIAMPFPQRDLHLRSPQLDEVLRAFTRYYSGEPEWQKPNGHEIAPATATELHNADAVEEDVGIRSWSNEQIDALVSRLRSPGGVPIMDRRHLLTVYRHCFVGREAVDWMTRACGLTRAEAVEIGQVLVDRGIVHHVLDEHGFRDGNFFYQFRQPPRADNRSIISA